MKKQEAIKKMTWKELKDFVNKLPEEELQKQIVWWGECMSGNVYDVNQLGEDWVETEDGHEPLSMQKELAPGEVPYPISYKKGTPIIYVETQWKFITVNE